MSRRSLDGSFFTRMVWGLLVFHKRISSGYLNEFCTLWKNEQGKMKNVKDFLK